MCVIIKKLIVWCVPYNLNTLLGQYLVPIGVVNSCLIFKNICIGILCLY